MKKIGFFFDLDGTLVNSQEAVMNSWTTLANEAGIQAREELQRVDHHLEHVNVLLEKSRLSIQ
jgi:beta-phosphoglucomutase-like phosphatase (HAD superfamily)